MKAQIKKKPRFLLKTETNRHWKHTSGSAFPRGRRRASALDLLQTSLTATGPASVWPLPCHAVCSHHLRPDDSGSAAFSLLVSLPGPACPCPAHAPRCPGFLLVTPGRASAASGSRGHQRAWGTLRPLPGPRVLVGGRVQAGSGFAAPGAAAIPGDAARRACFLGDTPALRCSLRPGKYGGLWGLLPRVLPAQARGKPTSCRLRSKGHLSLIR